MRVFKPTYTDRETGQAKQCSVYYIAFKDGQGIQRRLPAFTYETSTNTLAVKLNELLAALGNPSPQLLQWFEKQEPRIINKLSMWGLLPNKTVIENLNKTLDESVTDFCGELLVLRGPRYVNQVKSTLKRIFADCGFKTRADIDGGKIYGLLDQWKKRPVKPMGEPSASEGRRPISDRSFNCYLKTCHQFFSWMIRRGRAVTNPLDSFPRIEKPQKVVQRRALTLDEQCKLLDAAESGPVHHNLTGYERKLVYALALQTGLRVSEIKSLTVSSFNLTEGRVNLSGAYTKNKKQADIKLTPAMVVALKKYFTASQKLPTVKAFDMPNQAAKMIKRDLEAAGIPYKTDEGKADFHSLRHSFITGLSRSGAMPKEAQVAARHSTITLTMDYYTHTQQAAQDKIMESQPDIMKNVG
jgi:integrase